MLIQFADIRAVGLDPVAAPLKLAVVRREIALVYRVEVAEHLTLDLLIQRFADALPLGNQLLFTALFAILSLTRR